MNTATDLPDSGDGIDGRGDGDNAINLRAAGVLPVPARALWKICIDVSNFRQWAAGGTEGAETDEEETKTRSSFTSLRWMQTSIANMVAMYICIFGWHGSMDIWIDRMDSLMFCIYMYVFYMKVLVASMAWIDGWNVYLCFMCGWKIWLSCWFEF